MLIFSIQLLMWRFNIVANVYPFMVVYFNFLLQVVWACWNPKDNNTSNLSKWVELHLVIKLEYPIVLDYCPLVAQNLILAST